MAYYAVKGEKATGSAGKKVRVFWVVFKWGDELNWLKNRLDKKGWWGIGVMGKKWVEKPYKSDRKQSLLNKT